MNKHIMIDIETMGTQPGCAILSIAAVCFTVEEGIQPDQFYHQVNLKSCLAVGLTLEVDTTLWWLKQQPEAHLVLHNNHLNHSLHHVLTELAIYIRRHTEGCPDTYRIWSNPSRFDMAILQKAYDCCGIDLPWHHKHELDCRTLDYLRPAVRAAHEYVGVKHHALHDAVNQVLWATKILRQLQAQPQTQEVPTDQDMKRKTKIIFCISEILQKTQEIKLLKQQLHDTLTVSELQEGVDCSDEIQGNAIGGTVGYIEPCEHVKTVYVYKDLEVNLHHENGKKVLIKRLLDELAKKS